MEEAKDLQDFVTQQELQELRDKINKSFRNIVQMFMQLKAGLDGIEQRIGVYNTKGSHKI